MGLAHWRGIVTGHSREDSRAQRRRGNLEQARRDRGIRRRIRKGGVLAALSGVVVAGMTGSVLAAPPAADKGLFSVPRERETVGCATVGRVVAA